MMDLERVETMYRNAEASMVMAVDGLRKAGGLFQDHVLIIADVSHEATWLVMRDITGKESDRTQGLVAIVGAEKVARVLRFCKADDWADHALSPLLDGKMRVMVTADGQVNIVDLPAFPPLPAAGKA